MRGKKKNGICLGSIVFFKLVASVSPVRLRVFDDIYHTTVSTYYYMIVDPILWWSIAVM